MADSVSIFAEGSFEEQVRELVDYLARPREGEERTVFIQPFAEALRITEGSFADEPAKRRKVIELVLNEVKSLGEGSEREIEGFFNLLFAHLLELYPIDSPEASQHVKRILQLVATSSAPEHSIVKFRILVNLFNAIPRQSPLRLSISEALLDLADGDLELLQLSQPQIETWLKEWDIPLETKTAFLKKVADAFAKCEQQETAHAYLLVRLQMIPASSPLAEPAALETIASALRIPSIFDFESLTKIDVIQAAKSHPLFALLKIFLVDGIKEYTAWAEQNAAALTEFSLGNSQLARKIRLLTLASLGARYVGQDLPYAEIASALDVEIASVETWVIDVIRVGLLAGKLSQPAKTLRVTRAASRAFGKDEWQLLERRLTAWRTGLLGVLEVVAAARQGRAVPPLETGAAAA